jgi:hypothetical protein
MASVKIRVKDGPIQLGTVLADGSFTQEGARKLPHDPQDAGFADCVVCVCGEALRACQECCEFIHEDEMPLDSYGDLSEVCKGCK